jgi:hypothetical protein
VGEVPRGPELGGVPEDRSEPKIVVARRITRMRAAGPRPAGGRRSPEADAMSCWSVASPGRRTGRARGPAAAGRDEAAPGSPAVLADDRQNVLEEGIADQIGSRRDRVVDLGAAVEERLRLPHEVVVVAEGVPDRVRDEGDANERKRDPRRSPPAGPPLHRSVGPGVRRTTLCYAALHLNARAGGRFPS